MKKQLFFLTLFFAGAFMLSCEKEDISMNNENGNEVVIAVDEVFQAMAVDEIQITVDQFSAFGEGFLKSGSTVEGNCPEIKVEKVKEGQDWPRKVTLDFGENGCVKNEKTIIGKIIMIKTAHWMTPGSVREVTFENYSIAGVKISGNKRIENLTKAGGKVTFGIISEMTFTTMGEDGKEVKVVSRREDRKQVWQIDFAKFEIGKGNDFLKGVGFEFSGTSRIVTKKDSKEMVVEKKAKDVLVQIGCMFPQAGVVEFEVKDFEGKQAKFKLDYAATGTGTTCQTGCDCIAKLTVGDTTKDIDLSEKWRQQIPKK